MKGQLFPVQFTGGMEKGSATLTVADTSELRPGQLIRITELNDLSLDDLKSFSSLIEQDVFASLSLEQTLATKSQAGGTAPERVAKELEDARTRV